MKGTLGGQWQISVGDLAETLRPALFFFSVIASASVLADARRRGFSHYATAAWTLVTFLLPPVALPLYLIACLYTRRAALPDSPAAPTKSATEGPEPVSGDTGAAGSAGVPLGLSGQRAKDDATDSDLCESASSEARPHALWPSKVFRLHWLGLPVLYATAMLLLGAFYFYRDYTSFDAHIARARRAQLYKQRARAIREYAAALRRRDDAHTRKLLGVELGEAGRWEEALAAFRAATRGGEPDERLSFREAVALERLNRPAEAAAAYRRFLLSGACVLPEPDPLCGDAQARLSLQPAAQ